MDWRHEAACREVDPELFFPIGNSGPALLQIEEAKQVCRRFESHDCKHLVTFFGRIWYISHLYMRAEKSKCKRRSAKTR